MYVEITKPSQVTASFPITSDIDECSADPSPCDENADCINGNGSYSCTCKQGFTGNGSHCEGKYANQLLSFERNSASCEKQINFLPFRNYRYR